MNERARATASVCGSEPDIERRRRHRRCLLCLCARVGGKINTLSMSCDDDDDADATTTKPQQRTAAAHCSSLLCAVDRTTSRAREVAANNMQAHSITTTTTAPTTMTCDDVGDGGAFVN